MNYEQISRIIFREVEASGYQITERKSVTTNSVYYTLMTGKCQLLFRVSDHKTDKNVITLRVDHKNTEQNTINFVRNRINDLRHRHLKMILGI